MTCLIPRSAKAALHVRHVGVASLGHDLYRPLRAPASLAPDNDRGVFGNVGFHDCEKIRIGYRLPRPLVKEHHGNVHPSLRMAGGELWHRADIEVNDCRILIQDLMRLRRDDLLDRHRALLSFQVRSIPGMIRSQ